LQGMCFVAGSLKDLKHEHSTGPLTFFNSRMVLQAWPAHRRLEFNAPVVSNPFPWTH
jgi:hypothetical protein